jgi:hypothetical protein
MGHIIARSHALHMVAFSAKAKEISNEEFFTLALMFSNGDRPWLRSMTN